MTSFSIFPLGGFLSVSLSMSYLRENKRTQRRKREQLCLSQNYQNNNDIWRSVPESTPHGAPHMYKSFEKAALILRMASVTLSNFLTSAEHEAFYETLNDLEQRVQMCDSQLKRTVVIEGPQGCGASTLISNLTGDHPQSDYRESKILTLREKLKSLPQHLWAVLESVCDYCRIVDAELNPCHVTSDGIVFVERLYHSRLSSVLCMEDLFVDPSSLPASAYCWPKDLPHPALVLYLAVPFAERQHRPHQTPMTSGMYERNQMIHSMVTGGPQFVAIDASGNQKDVYDTAIQCCQIYNIGIRNNMTAHEKNEFCGSDEYERVDVENENPIIINLSDAIPSRPSEVRREQKRQSLGWYGAFMSTAADDASD